MGTTSTTTQYISSLHKEHSLYNQEIMQLAAKREKFIVDKAEEWDIKNAVSPPCETNTSPPNPRIRLRRES